MLDVFHQLKFHSLSEELHLKILALLTCEYVRTIVSVLQHKSELADVAGLLELCVMRVKQETLAHRTAESLRIAVVYVVRHHLWLHRHLRVLEINIIGMRNPKLTNLLFTINH